MSAAPSSGGAARPEIERVFLLRGMPPLPPHAELWEIEQGYLPRAESESDLEGRLRRQVEGGTTRHLLTRKRGVGLVRSEEEREIPAEEFAKWWPRTEGRRLRKTRHRVAAGGVIWEIDRFSGLELVLAEVELPDPRTPLEIPPWLAPLIVREVTEDPRYRNFELARRGGLLPEERA